MAKNNKSFEILYNESERLNNLSIDEDKVFVFDKRTGDYIPVGAFVPEESKEIVKKIKTLRENELAFVMAYQKPILECISSLTPHEVKLLFFLAAKCSYGNKVYDMGYTQIAKEARMSKDTITKAMQKLKSEKLIHAKPFKNRYIYTVNPSIFWRGSHYAVKDTMNLFVDKDVT
jgi:DNA-binding MarR family transcriptional regulator